MSSFLPVGLKNGLCLSSLGPAGREEVLDRVSACLKALWGSLYGVSTLAFEAGTFFSPCSAADNGQSSPSERRETKLSLTLSSHVSLPTADSSWPPSSKLSPSMINVLLGCLGKEDPILLFCSPGRRALPPLFLQCCLNTSLPQPEVLAVSLVRVVRPNNDVHSWFTPVGSYGCLMAL